MTEMFNPPHPGKVLQTKVAIRVDGGTLQPGRKIGTAPGIT